MRIRKVFKGLYLILVFYLLLIPVTVSANQIDVPWSDGKFLGIEVAGVETVTDKETKEKKSILTNSYKLDADSTDDVTDAICNVIEQALEENNNISGIYNACKGTGLGSFATDSK